MMIDARRSELRELFKELKDVLGLHCGENVFIEVLIESRSDAKKVNAFASMSGCHAEIEEKNGYYVIQITGSPCCV